MSRVLASIKYIFFKKHEFRVKRYRMCLIQARANVPGLQCLQPEALEEDNKNI